MKLICKEYLWTSVISSLTSQGAYVSIPTYWWIVQFLTCNTHIHHLFSFNCASILYLSWPIERLTYLKAYSHFWMRSYIQPTPWVCWFQPFSSQVWAARLTTTYIRHSILLVWRDLLASIQRSLHTHGGRYFWNSAAVKMAFHLNYIGAVLSRRERTKIAGVLPKLYAQEGEMDAKTPDSLRDEQLLPGNSSVHRTVLHNWTTNSYHSKVFTEMLELSCTRFN